MSKEVGFKLGKLFSNVTDVIVPPIGRNEGRHMKILVEIDLSKPLLRGTTLNVNGDRRWVNFKYEKCPDFCYSCGLVGHGNKMCPLNGVSTNNHSEAQFGTWLRAGGKGAKGGSSGFNMVVQTNRREGENVHGIPHSSSVGLGPERAQVSRHEGLDVGNVCGLLLIIRIYLWI